MIISKLAGSPFASKVSRLFTKFTGKAPTYKEKVDGVVCRTNFKTGTRVLQNIDGEGMKVISLGKGNRLRSEYGIKNITVYPKGSFFGGKDGLILCPPNSNSIGWPMTIEEFGKHMKFLEECKAEGLLATA